MNKKLLKATFLCAGVASLAFRSECVAFEPVAPGSLDAKVNGIVVGLSWEWGNADKCLLSESFEDDTFPPSGWEVKNHFNYDEYGNWMQYDFSEEEPEMQLCHDGTKGAVLMIGVGDDDEPATSHQDEWLIVRPGEGAVYMDFWYFLHPELREVGGYEDFPDHYYVQISFDNGESWEELWDGRWDMGTVEGMQQASLFLGTEADENTLVAFHAVSGEQESLYFLWTVDDVRFYSADEAAAPAPAVTLSAHRDSDLSGTLAGKQLFRKFTPSSSASAKSVKRKAVSPDEWLNNGNLSYRVYLDDEMLFSYVKARQFTDYSNKEPGTHTYRVMAWSEAMDEEYEAATVDVEIDNYEFPAPRNLEVRFETQDNGRFTVAGTWEAPEGDVTPANYIVYINGKSVGWIDGGEELAVGQSGLYKGVYTFEVEACYVYPEGTSERVEATVFPGTLPAPVNLVLTEDAGNVTLDWEQPVVDGYEPAYFTVYRGDVLVADNLGQTSFTDGNVPSGTYAYSVHSVYPDGSVSLPVSVAYTSGAPSALQLPFEENFDNGHLPSGWSVELVDPYDRIKDMYSWRFDNWFDNEIPSGYGIEGGFASVSGVAAGMNRLESYLYTPVIALPADDESVLRFSKCIEEGTPGPSGPAGFIVAASPAGEDLYETLADLREMENGDVIVPLGGYKGMDIVLRWGFIARNSGFAAIDNVSVAKGNSVALMPENAEVCDVFSIDGKSVGTNVSPAFLDSLPSGIYLIRDANGNTAKYLKK